jgi:hypothetical protein
MTDSLEVLAGKAFDDLYLGDIEPELRRLEAKRQQALQALALFLVAGVLMMVVEGLLTRSIGQGKTSFPPVGFVVITLLIAGYAGYRPLKNVEKAVRANIITALCRPLGVTYQENRVEAPAFQRFVDLRLLPRSDSRTFEDRFAGRRADRAFAFCEATLIQGSGRRLHTAFKGLLFQVAFSRPFDGVTVVLRDSGLLNRFECPPDLTRVALDDPQFEQAFEVFGSDQFESRALLTPVFIRQLLVLERAFAGDGLRCAFVDGDVLIALEGHDRFEVGGVLTSLVERRRVVDVARGLSSVFKLIDSFTG